ncbi:MAG TPA: dihydrolipoamide acetyltransferase family protein, partial [Candidatus Binatia bacterium]|nr:dihydrolipoamide acetyltransferase family protein [Candidatus Binatia bacterium]
GAGAATEEAPAPAGEAAPSADEAEPAKKADEAEPAQPEAAADAGAQATEQQEQAPAAAAEPATPDATAEPAPPAPAASGGDGAARMTPAVRRLVRENQIDISQLSGSGAGGRVTREDVLAYIEKGSQAAAAPADREPATGAESAAPPAAEPKAEAVEKPKPAGPAPASVPAPVGGDTEVVLSQMRKAIAKKMTQVKQTVPHAYTVVEVDMTGVVKWREANNMAFKAREGASLSYVAVLVKVVTDTLRKHPTLNSQFADDKIILKQAMNIGIAVAVDNGLIVPVIANADQLSISGVNARIRDISSRAHAGKLRLDELQGGTFTVNNTGWFGSVSSMPIVNAPEVAILSMEAIVKRARVMEIDGADVIAIRHMMNMTCSFDHRVLDGAQVGFFLADVRKALEEWDAGTPLG